MRASVAIPVGLMFLGAVALGTGGRLEGLLGYAPAWVSGNPAAADPVKTVAETEGPILAQADGRVPPRSQPPARQQAVDETALRYFAAQGDTKRLEAEIARLKALYPNWTPPKDPLAVQPAAGDAQLDAMWKLYSDGKFAEVRKAIADRSNADPNWKPPQDLLDRLAVAEAREQLVNASNLKQYDAVVRIGATNASLLTCGDVDVLWRVAEAFAKTDRRERAQDVYLYVLKNCEKPQERLATVQKALPLLSRQGIDMLLTEERKTPDGEGEFDSVRADIARQTLADAGKDPKLVVPPNDLALVEKLADAGKLASDDLLLGWYHLRRDDPRSAEKWFRKAYEAENSAAAAQGLALSLVDTGQPGQAEAVLYKWRDANDDTRKVYLAAATNLLATEPPPQLSQEVLQRMSRAVAAAKDTPAGQQFGWYADALNQFDTAAQWFELALSWTPTDEPSAYGLALMRWKQRDEPGVRKIQRAWTGRSERIARVGDPEDSRRDATRSVRPNAPATTTPAQPLRKSVEPTRDATEAIGQTRPARRAGSANAPARPRSCSTTEDPNGLSPAQALSRGWCLMEINRPLEAAAAFEIALRGSGTARSDAAYGQSLAYLRAGLVDMAAVAATKAPLGGKRGTEIRTALLEQQALAAFENGRYRETLSALEERARIAPDRLNLMVLRGYAYLKLRRFADAEQVFRAAAATGDHDALRGLGDLQQARDAN